jgi:hypothetical protein
VDHAREFVASSMGFWSFRKCAAKSTSRYPHGAMMALFELVLKRRHARFRHRLRLVLVNAG